MFLPLISTLACGIVLGILVAKVWSHYQASIRSAATRDDTNVDSYIGSHSTDVRVEKLNAVVHANERVIAQGESDAPDSPVPVEITDSAANMASTTTSPTQASDVVLIDPPSDPHAPQGQEPVLHELSDELASELTAEFSPLTTQTPVQNATSISGVSLQPSRDTTRNGLSHAKADVRASLSHRPGVAHDQASVDRPVTDTAHVAAHAFDIGNASLHQLKSITSMNEGNGLGPSSILWQMLDGICVRDVNGNLLSYNPAWLSVWGLDAPAQGMYTRVQMLGCYREDGISPLPQIEAPMFRAMRGETVHNQKIIVDNHTRDNSVNDARPGPRARTYLVSGHPLLDKTGRQYAAYVVMRDVSERTEAVYALTRERSLLRNILEVIPDGFVLRDMNGKAILHNAAYRQKRGPFDVDTFTDELLVENLFNADNDSPVPQNECPMHRALSGEGFVNQRVYVRKQDGIKIDLLISGYPIYNDSGEQIGAFTLERDVTDIKRASLIRARNSRLAALGMMVGGVAHDFNNQLAAILGSAQVARLMSHDVEKVEHHLKTIESATNTSAELVRRLGSIGNRPSGTVELLDISEFLIDYGPVLNSLFDEQQPVNIVSSDTPLVVICEKAQLESAVLNMLVNAREAVELRDPEQRQISLSARRVVYDNVCWNSGLQGAFIEIEVSDNGCGMSAESVERAMESDYSSKASHAPKGLGLPMVFGFARMNGGDAHIDSQLDQGTRVKLALPESTDHALCASDMSSMQLPMGSNQTILVVDNDSAMLATMSEMLRALNYLVICASNGHDALNYLAHDESICLAIIDIVLPDEFNGIEVARQANAVQPELAVIFVSGYSGSATESMGAYDWPFLQKPISLPGLANMVADMVPDFRLDDSPSQSHLRLH